MNKLIVSFLLAIFFLASAVQAQPMTGPGKDKMAPKMERNQMGCCMGAMCGHQDGLPNIPDLTDEQKAKLEELKIEHMKIVQPLDNQLAEKQAQLHTLSTAAEVNMSKINSLIEDIGKLRTDIMKEKETHHQAVRKLLTEKQRLIFDSQPGFRHGMND
jgi:Spy/CpxP family protein refolding chaperone